MWFGSVNSGVGTVFSPSVIVVCGSLCGLFSQCKEGGGTPELTHTHTTCEIFCSHSLSLAEEMERKTASVNWRL